MTICPPQDKAALIELANGNLSDWITEQVRKENETMNPYELERKYYYCPNCGEFWYVERDDTHDWSDGKHWGSDYDGDDWTEKPCSCTE